MRKCEEYSRCACLLCISLSFASGLAGCQSNGAESAGQAPAGFGPENSAPVITGTPPGTITVGKNYAFSPTIEDADGDELTISVTGLPDWAGFDGQTGTISGMPTESDVGTYTGIAIRVSDGSLTDTLGPFSVEVISQGVAIGSVTLQWTAPTANSDGSTLHDLAGYRIYWGPSVGDYRHSVSIENPAVTRYVIDNLDPGTYAFVATAVNAEGVESSHSRATIATVD